MNVSLGYFLSVGPKPLLQSVTIPHHAMCISMKVANGCFSPMHSCKSY